MESLQICTYMYFTIVVRYQFLKIGVKAVGLCHGSAIFFEVFTQNSKLRQLGSTMSTDIFTLK